MSQPIHQRSADLPGLTMTYLEAGPADAGPAGAEPGDAPPVLLIHGFASTAAVNWRHTGWLAALADAGRRAIAIDNRGHGGSARFYDASDYGPDIFAADAVALLDRLGIERVDVVGYSMGARIALWLGHAHAARVRRIALCGMGERMFVPPPGGGRSEAIAAALEADDPDTIEDGGARAFRVFAERTGSDLRALAACIRPSRTRITRETVESVGAPTLVAVGTEDDVAGDPRPLVEALPDARLYRAEGRDHMRAVGDRGIMRAVIGFLS